jgi:hypothetical protein
VERELLSEEGQRLVRVPTAAVIGIGRWGSLAADAAARGLFAFAPDLLRIVRVVSLRQEDDQSLAMVSWPWAPVSSAPDRDEAAWQAMVAGAAELRQELESHLADARSPEHDEALAGCHARRLVLPDHGLPMDVFILADYAEPGAGLWASEIACATRGCLLTVGPGLTPYVVGISTVLDSEANEQDRNVQAGRALLRLWEQDVLAEQLATASSSPEESLLCLPANEHVHQLAGQRWPLFNVVFHVGRDNVLGHRLPEERVVGLAGSLVQLFLLTHEQLLQRERGEEGLLAVPEQSIAPGRSCYGSLGCGTVYYPRREMLTYGAARMATLAIRRCALLPTEQLSDDERARAEEQFYGLFVEASLPLDAGSFVTRLEEKISHDDQGNRLIAPQGWEVAVDERNMERWPEEIADYEVLLLSKLRRAAYFISENAQRERERLAAAVAELTDETIKDASRGIKWAEQILRRGKHLLDEFWREFSRRIHAQPPDTEAARQRLARAIARMPNGWFLLTRAMLFGVPLGLFIRVVAARHLPQLVANWTVAVGPLLGLLLAMIFWLVRRADVWHKRNDAVAAAEEKARLGVRELVRQQVQPLVNRVITEVESELNRLSQLRYALALLETKLWRGYALPQVGEWVAWQTLAPQYGPDGRDREGWEGSSVLQDFDCWCRQPPQKTSPEWQVEAMQATAISPDEFEQALVATSVVYTEQNGPQTLWQELLDNTQPYTNWREALNVDLQGWADRVAQELVDYLAERAQHFECWRTKTVDDVLTEQADEDERLGREPGRVQEMWEERVVRFAAPSAIPRTEAASGIQGFPQVRALFAPSVRQMASDPAAADARTPLAALAQGQGQCTFLPCASEVHCFFVSGFAGVPLECLGNVYEQLEARLNRLGPEVRSRIEVAARAHLCPKRSGGGGGQ